MENLRYKEPIGAGAQQQRRAFLGSDILFVTTETPFYWTNKTEKNVTASEQNCRNTAEEGILDFAHKK